MARLLHDLHYTVEIYRVTAVAECGVKVCVEGSGRCIGVALYAWYLYETAYRVACEAEMMLETHLGGVFDLDRKSTRLNSSHWS